MEPSDGTKRDILCAVVFGQYTPQKADGIIGRWILFLARELLKIGLYVALVVHVIIGIGIIGQFAVRNIVAAKPIQRMLDEVGPPGISRVFA